MAKAHRSPLLGYNHNIGHLGRVFHVQTEDSGPISPRVFTHLFHEGIILVSRKVEYEAMLADDKVRVLMQTQHRAVIKELAAGAFNERIIAFFRARGVELPVATVAPAAPAGTGSVAAAPATANGSGVPGAVPSAPILGEASAQPAPPPAAAAAPAAVVPATAAAVVAPSPPPAHTAPPRRNTRPIETGRTRKPTPPPVTVRPPDSRRPPFVRSGAPAVAKTASADGVVVQRSVVVGGSSTGEGRPRIRPPVPYIVTGGSHPVRPATTTATVSAAAKVTAATTVTVGAAAAGVAAAGAAAEAKVPGPAQAPGLAAGDAPARTGVFGPPVPDDKSLDEVILEYLSEDGE